MLGDVSAALRGYLLMTCDIIGQLSLTGREYPRGRTQWGHPVGTRSEPADDVDLLANRFARRPLP